MADDSQKHFVVLGRIPGADDDTMAHVQVLPGLNPASVFIREILYGGSLPCDWESRAPLPSENRFGEWAYIHQIIGIPGPPLV
jgi:hypothetical protein